MSDITAILTAHSEGVLAGPSLASFEEAIDHARQAGRAVDSLIMLDRADAATRLQFAGAGARHRVMECNEGDPGLVRNAAVALSSGTFVAFLDADDLWSYNWLAAAHDLVRDNAATLVAHSEINVVFGEQRQIWLHRDSRDPSFDAGYLRLNNYWMSLSFGARDIYRRVPFVANDYARGFGVEGWHWNCRTILAGIDHAPAPGTVHFVRRRRSTQTPLAVATNAVPWITPLASYAWHPAIAADPSEVAASTPNGVIDVDGFLVGDGDGAYARAIVESLITGAYEKRERDLLPRVLGPTDRVIELGTAAGLVTMAAASIVGAEAVLTFDANPRMARDARRNFGLNGLDEIKSRFGLLRNRASFVPGEQVDFHVSREFVASRLHASGHDGDIQSTIQAPAYCLEDEIAKHRANVLVCDIEGGEVDLLSGADLSGIDRILLETHYRWVGKPATDELIRRLVIAGFAIDLELSGMQVLVLHR